MIINEFDLKRIAVGPTKADAPLIINTNAVLSGPIAAQLFEAIAGWHTQIVQRLGGINRNELAEHDALELRWISADRLSAEQPFGVSIAKAFDHRRKLGQTDHNVKRYYVVLANAPANLRASHIKCERSELPQIARQVQRSLESTHEEP
jgi:hypothetical protein